MPEKWSGWLERLLALFFLYVKRVNVSLLLASDKHHIFQIKRLKGQTRRDRTHTTSRAVAVVLQRVELPTGMGFLRFWRERVSKPGQHPGFCWKDKPRAGLMKTTLGPKSNQVNAQKPFCIPYACLSKNLCIKIPKRRKKSQVKSFLLTRGETKEIDPEPEKKKEREKESPARSTPYQGRIPGNC